MTVYNSAELEFYQLEILRVQRNASRRAASLVKKWIAAHPNWEAADLRNACIQIVQVSSISVFVFNDVKDLRCAPAITHFCIEFLLVQLDCDLI